MMVSTHLAVLILINVMLSVSADWQVELRLISYNNPRGLTEDMECCDATLSPGVCLFSETCDTEFAIRVINFDRLLRQLGSSVLVGIYQEMDFIMFPACGTLEGGQSNPIVFTFPSSEFSVGETMRFIYDVSDEDINPISGSRTTVNISPQTIFELPPLQSTNSQFTMASIGGSFLVDLTITFEYRVICTPGTCGSDCSQTTNCPGFPAACGAPAADCDDDTPCSNGGTCQGTVCVCPEPYTGTRCENMIPTTAPTQPTTTPTTTPTTMLANMPTSTPSDPVTATQGGSDNTGVQDTTQEVVDSTSTAASTSNVGGTSEALGVFVTSEVLITLMLFLLLTVLLMG